MKQLLDHLRSLWRGAFGAPNRSAFPATPIRASHLWDEPLGEISRAELEATLGWAALIKRPVTLDPQALAILSAHADDTETLVFLGTWCGDTRREVPRFLAIVDAAGWKSTNIRTIALDRSKRDAQGLTDAWEIHAVPTFVLLRAGQEIGRVVERPAELLERDLAKIVSRA